MKRRLYYNEDGTLKRECINCLNQIKRTSAWFYCDLSRVRINRHAEACEDFAPATSLQYNTYPKKHESKI